MRTFLFLASLLTLYRARTLLVQTEDKDEPDIRAIRGNEGMKAFIDNNPAPGDGRSRERRKGTNKMAGGNCHPWCGTGTEVSPTLAAGECWSDSDCGNGEGCNPTQPIPDAPRQPGSCLQDRAHIDDWTYTNAAEPGVIG